ENLTNACDAVEVGSGSLPSKAQRLSVESSAADADVAAASPGKQHVLREERSSADKFRLQ
uniref:Uncharacterized protein n=1 Tax=Romanomermis culicivorax TaxID=13658 RepID=A0A915JWW3_ROMCU